ncbi:Inosine-uridine preferring nucleoside hydrolase [[Actinomadura] parvosata subsp. kistnae]|uniref:Nucleoside hydrolase n=1 Tax=[Actinomadura] parvosata subsp. kistnae TaxID=1909395 RepID=A0A1V0AGB3_9ACTN|nr:nucleoside hydrolase [Nonomuraea sp. ATCC 55076]AQZ69219.1 nucleoside hydrolase [Nonomuraea sp. ATCC 55076]SPL92169.1 Inosine-uridine preferring nucleoside hydrolase [Actinomadura parvosata subsp. kistnae]
MKKVLIDCDPGIDDALALALAAGCADSLDIVGVTTVGGNVDLEFTTANALALREFLQMGDVPVTPGSAGALLRRTVRATAVHGDTGLGDVVLPAPRLGPSEGHAVDFIVETLKAAPGEITLVAVGPLSNIALAVRREPRIVQWARDLVIMGGSYTRGNHNPAAEFNMLADPEAAAIVFEAGWTVTMLGLDVTLRATLTSDVLERMRPLGRLADLLVPAAQFYGVVTAEGGPAIHDACAVAYVLDPGLFTCVPAVVNVETMGEFTRGMTVTDFRLRDRRANALVATAVDVPAFWDLVIGAYEKLATRLG